MGAVMRLHLKTGQKLSITDADVDAHQMMELGGPIVMIQDGKVIDRNLKRERLTEEELAMEARLQQIDSLDKVEWAILEKGGQISFITKT
jgi:uncharacterized membrane protein YcaP (DUF421 family)